MKNGQMQCPYCQFAIGKDLVGSSLRFDCPQCGRPLRVTAKYLFEAFCVAGSVVFMVWLWAKLIRGISFWGFDYPLIVIATCILAGPIVPLLPRELWFPSRKEQSDVYTTLGISSSERPDTDPDQP